jgi:hypothetical protein
MLLDPAHRGRDEGTDPHRILAEAPVLMIGLAGLLLTSATGAKAIWTPTARPSSAVIRPTS